MLLTYAYIHLATPATRTCDVETATADSHLQLPGLMTSRCTPSPDVGKMSASGYQGWLSQLRIQRSGAEGGSRTHTPVRILRPERSASTVPPLRHISEASGVRDAAIRTVSTWWAIEDLNLGPLACEASALTAELTAQGQFHLTALAYVPPHWSGNDRVRTCDLALMKRPLYR